MPPPRPAPPTEARAKQERDDRIVHPRAQPSASVGGHGALLAFTRTARAFVHLASLHGERRVSVRLRALLDDSTSGRVSILARGAAVAVLGTIFIGGLLPVQAAARTLALRQRVQIVAMADHAATRPRRTDP